MKVVMQIFALPLLALLYGRANAQNTSEVRGRRVQTNAEMGLGDYQDVAHHKRSKSSDEFTGDFQDNSLGYCILGSLGQIEELDLLTKTSKDLVELFLDMYEYYNDDSDSYEEANRDLRDWVELVRTYMSAENSAMFSDREILAVVMEQELRSDPQRLTSACITAIQDAVTKTLAEFNKYMNVGESFEPPNDAYLEDAAMHHDHDDEDDTTFPVLLEALTKGNAGADTFKTFMSLILHYYAVFNPNLYFNQDWLQATRSWQEMALSPVSILAKWAAVALTNGEDLEFEFLISGEAAIFQEIYEATVATCNAPTSMPSSAPSLTPATANEVLTVVAVSDFVAASVTAEEMRSSWVAFSTQDPKRRFCLLQLRENNADDLKEPTEFLTSPQTTYAKVNADDGNAFDQSDWYDLCNLYTTDDQGIGTIPLYNNVKNGGKDVRKSAEYFMATVTGAGQTITTAPDDATSISNWIQPFVKDFLTN